MVLLERAKTLLKATKELLEETVFYDEAECDGYCLKDDIGDWFDELEEQETVQKGGKE